MRGVLEEKASYNDNLSYHNGNILALNCVCAAAASAAWLREILR